MPTVTPEQLTAAASLYNEVLRAVERWQLAVLTDVHKDDEEAFAQAVGDMRVWLSSMRARWAMVQLGEDWTPLGARLPDDGQLVWPLLADRRVVGPAYYVAGHAVPLFISATREGPLVVDGVTHYQPVAAPKPPAASEIAQRGGVLGDVMRRMTGEEP